MAVVAVKKRQIKKEITCPNCENLLSYEKEDVEIGHYGCECITCPECGEKILITGERIMPPTFPKTFYHFGSGKKISDKDIQEMINKVVDNIKITYVGDFYVTAIGYTVVVALSFDFHFDVIVVKDYLVDTLMDEV